METTGNTAVALVSHLIGATKARECPQVENKRHAPPIQCHLASFCDWLTLKEPPGPGWQERRPI